MNCQYRFTNLQIRAPSGIHTVAVEAVYDTSSKVEPHEHLWLGLQEGFIRDGNLILTSRDQADLYAQIHLAETGRIPDKLKQFEESTAKVAKSYAAKNPPAISDFENFKQAPKFSAVEKWYYVVVVEIFDTRNRERLFSKRYVLSENYPTYDNLGSNGSMFAASEERFEEDLLAQASEWGRKVVRDFLMSQS